MRIVEASFLANATKRSGVFLLSDATPFEELYERTRGSERRILSDEQVAQLPDGTDLWNVDEWRIRARSADRLVRALRGSDLGSRVLEVGCGNGWLSARLQREGHEVLGIDPFTAELEQAARVFPNGPAFARCDLFEAGLPQEFFDIIVFAASFQYFPDAQKALARASSLLRPSGEIHVMDSVLYRSPVEKTGAEERSRKYYENLGVPEMHTHYHAHAMDDLKGAHRVRVLSAPSGMERTLHRFGKLASPFTHVVISAQ